MKYHLFIIDLHGAVICGFASDTIPAKGDVFALNVPGKQRRLLVTEVQRNIGVNAHQKWEESNQVHVTVSKEGA